MRLLRIVPVVVGIMMIAGVIFISAQDDPLACTPDGSNGIPCSTPQDNECFEGGALACEDADAGPCARDSATVWACGWYLARYNANRISSIPEWCEWALPPVPSPEIAPTIPPNMLCAIFGSTGGYSGSYCEVNNNTWVFDLGGDGNLDSYDVVFNAGTVCPNPYLGRTLFSQVTVAGYGVPEVTDTLLAVALFASNDEVCRYIP